MATFKLLAFSFTILYFFAFAAARNLHFYPKNVAINRRDTTASDHVSKASSSGKRTIFLPTQDHEPDHVISVELEPEDVDQLNKFTKHEDKLSEPTAVEMKRFNKNDLNDDRKVSDTTPVEELESEMSGHKTEHKIEEHGESNQEHHELDHDLHHESDHDLPVKEHHESDEMPIVSENTISIETLHLHPSNYFRIRPINRHFRVKPSIFRIHRCHHNHHMNSPYHNHHPVPYGNDMILARDDIIVAGQNSERFDPSTLHINMHSDPAKKAMTHHHDEDENMMMRRPFRQYIAKQNLKKKVEEEIQKRKESDARKQGGFMKSFRKFLNHL